MLIRSQVEECNPDGASDLRLLVSHPTAVVSHCCEEMSLSRKSGENRNKGPRKIPRYQGRGVQPSFEQVIGKVVGTFKIFNEKNLKAVRLKRMKRESGDVFSPGVE